MQRIDGPILPGATVGVLGSGQLGRMFALEARRMGYRVQTYSDGRDTPTGHIADKEWVAAYDDLDQVRQFADAVDVVTFEFENVLHETTQAAAEKAPVRPGGAVLHTTQNRLREKAFLSDNGFPLPPFRAVNSRDDLVSAIETLGYPCVLKTAGWGYDGKGQTKLNSAADIENAWEALGAHEGVLESWVAFAHEASVVAARGRDGSFRHFGLLENTHVNHILDITLSPGRLPGAVETHAVEIARGILDKLDVIGVLCVEFFVLEDGSLLVNELAPRPHNSGHVTLDNCETSQFEQQLRAICGLPLGETRRLRPAAMLNLLGDLWSAGEPDWAAALGQPELRLHLYGKTEARPGRKMGHLTCYGDTPGEALERVETARGLLTPPA